MVGRVMGRLVYCVLVVLVYDVRMVVWCCVCGSRCCCCVAPWWWYE